MALLKRDVQEPLYVQIVEDLLEKIKQDTWKEGDLLPSEHDLQIEYGVSRSTIRQALEMIEREGIIERRRGVGTIVRHERIKPEIMKLTSFSEDMITRGLSPGSKTLDVDFLVPPSRAREGLGIATKEKVWCIKRLRLADNVPVGIHTLYIPPDLQFAPRELQEMESYYQLLLELHSLKPAHAVETLTASMANEADASLLQISEGDPLLEIWRTTYSEDERVLEAVTLLYIAKRYEYHVQLYA